jgi:hypothetical protein
MAPRPDEGKKQREHSLDRPQNPQAPYMRILSAHMVPYNNDMQDVRVDWASVVTPCQQTL